MGLLLHAPSAPLSAFVAQLWDCDVDPQAPALERLLPSPAASIVINLLEDQTRLYRDDPAGGALVCERASGSVFGGPSTTSAMIDTAEQVRVMGVVFHPGGAAPLLRENLAALDGRDIDLAPLLGDRATGLRERLLATSDAATRLRLLERWLLGLVRAPGRDRRVQHALTRLDHAPAVAGIATLSGELGLSPRRFGALFVEQVGLSPKRYARLRRFQGVIAQVHRRQAVDWARVAADAGFHDQPHLVREFRAFAGLSPTQYLARQGDFANHVTDSTPVPAG